MTIVESLLEYVKTTPDKIALTDGKNAMTYRQLCGGIFGAVDILKKDHTCDEDYRIAYLKEYCYL